MAPVGGAQQKPEVRTQNGDVLASDFRPLEFGFRLLKSLTMVGLGRLELPTSRLSSARSNQLSYKPLGQETVISRRKSMTARRG